MFVNDDLLVTGDCNTGVQAVTELQVTLENMEMQEESRAQDVDEMALYLLNLREKLNDMQSDAEQKDLENAESEEQALREMHQVHLTSAIVPHSVNPAVSMNLLLIAMHCDGSQCTVVMQERLSLLERQMHLITELAASEFTILSLTEELEEAHQNASLLQEENALLMAECGMLKDYHVRYLASRGAPQATPTTKVS
jgi:glycyl-tRNA synthetase (class II)